MSKLFVSTFFKTVKNLVLKFSIPPNKKIKIKITPQKCNQDLNKLINQFSTDYINNYNFKFVNEVGDDYCLKSSNFDLAEN